MSYISCQQQSHDVVFQRNQSQQIQQKTNIYQVMKYPNRNISNVIYLQQQRQQLRVITMLGCNKPEELILFEHFYCTYNYNWDWAQDRPLPIQRNNAVEIYVYTT